MGKCGVCGNDVSEKRSLNDGEIFLRCAISIAVVLTILILAVLAANLSEDYALMKAINDPSLKVNIKHYDANGRVTKEITR